MTSPSRSSSPELPAQILSSTCDPVVSVESSPPAAPRSPTEHAARQRVLHELAARGENDPSSRDRPNAGDDRAEPPRAVSARVPHARSRADRLVTPGPGARCEVVATASGFTDTAPMSAQESKGVRLVKTSEISTLDHPCGAGNDSYTVLPGGGVKFTFPDMDRQCGDCSLFRAEISLFAGAPNPRFTFRGTVNSSDGGDSWKMRISFRRGGQELFSSPSGDWWVVLDIHDANAPKNYEVTEFTNAQFASSIPANFMEATEAYLYGKC